jgi:hypothetical protein
MKKLTPLACVLLGLLAGSVNAQDAAAAYKVLDTTKLMGDGGIDFVTVDSDGRRVYVPRGGQTFVFDLDSHKYVGAVTNCGGRGVAVDTASHHGFSSAGKIAMFDTETMQKLKDIDVGGRPDGIMLEPLTDRIYILSHEAPNLTAIDPKDGLVTGTLQVGGAVEQSQSDGQGKLYMAIEDEKKIAVVDVKTLKLITKYDLGDGAGEPAGLGLDVKNHILFAMCAKLDVCVVLNADDGKVLATLPLGNGTDGGGFNPATMEAWSSQRDGTLTIIKENSPTSFEVEQTVQTKPGGKCCSLDTKTGHIIVTAIEAAPAAADAAPATPPPGGDQPAGDRRGRGRGGRGGPGLLDVIVVGR